MPHFSLSAGQTFPKQQLVTLTEQPITLGIPGQNFDWQLVVVYRGAHCPLCTRYLQQLNQRLSAFHRLGVEVVAVSADPVEKAKRHLEEIQPQFPVGYGLSLTQMRQLGLYISTPRSPEETDRPFAEPGLFLINDSNTLQLLDISNAPFARPDLDSLLMGIEFIKSPHNDYPIRGTHD